MASEETKDPTEHPTEDAWMSLLRAARAVPQAERARAIAAAAAFFDVSADVMRHLAECPMCGGPVSLATGERRR